jgi:phosphoribosyl 1,2-cyclic phosphodiesterase
MRVSVLGSGSRGNAILLESGETRVLVDVGFGPRSLARRLRTVGCAPESITDVVLTHEHIDHASGALAACARWGWSLHATGGTLAALASSGEPRHTITHGQPWAIGDLVGHSVAVPHDAADCAALVFESRSSGCRAGIALDLGHVPTHLATAFSQLDVLVVEANHDEAVLMAGPYPWALKQRILGAHGHLSNAAAAAFVASCTHVGLRTVVLAHLSETNNSPTLAVDSVRTALQRVGRAGVSAAQGVLAAHQRESVGPLVVGASPAVSGAQLRLPL